MTYTMDESHSSPNYTAAANVQAAFGYPRNIIGSTIHHWDAKNSGATWDGTMNTLMNDYRNPGSRGVSIHYMVESGRAACLVSVPNAAWHSGNPVGNAQTVGFELNPDESNGTYQTTAEVLAQVWFDWDIPHKLFHHGEWTSTDCPGGYDLVRLRRMAEAEYAKLKGTKPKPLPQKDWFDMATKDELRDLLRSEGWGYKNPAVDKRDAYAILRDTNKATSKVDALAEVVRQLAAKQGVTIDYAKVEAAAAAGVAKAMADGVDLEATVTVKKGDPNG